MGVDAARRRPARDVDPDVHGRRRRGLRGAHRRPQPAPFRRGLRQPHEAGPADRPRRADDRPVQRARRRGPARSRQRLPPPGVGLPGAGLHRRHGHGRGRGHRGARRQADHDAALRRPARRRHRGPDGHVRRLHDDPDGHAVTGDGATRQAGAAAEPARALVAARDPRRRDGPRDVAVVRRGGGRADPARGVDCRAARPAVPDRRRAARVRRRGDRAGGDRGPRRRSRRRACSPPAPSSPRSPTSVSGSIATDPASAVPFRFADRRRAGGRLSRSR